jgi:glucosyl-dolichyl phosphate glucuronosyltransferase
MTISVVVCAFASERFDALVDAVESVARQTLPPLEVIVVVDHNLELLERARSALVGVRVEANRHARGLSGARNTGVAAASGDVIAFLDDDAVAAPDWLVRLAGPYRDPAVAGVGGAIEPRWLGGRPAGFPREFDWVVGCTYRGMPDGAAPVRNLIGANMSLRREVFGLVGGFRAGMGRLGGVPAGCEETELCIRARQRLPQAVFLFEPRARVAHTVPHARATWTYFGSRCYAEGLSKAQVAWCTGARDGLASERAYTLRTLPTGVLHGLAELVRGDPSGLTRSAAIIGGLVLTTLGYLVGALRLASASHPAAP